MRYLYLHLELKFEGCQFVTKFMLKYFSTNQPTSYYQGGRMKWAITCCSEGIMKWAITCCSGGRMKWATMWGGAERCSTAL